MREHFQVTLTQKLKTKGKGKGVEPMLSYSSRRNIWVVFHMAMKWALIEGYIDRLPGVLEAKPRESRIEQTRKQVEQFEFAETRWKPRAVLIELAGREDEAQWLIQLVMACRQSEKLGLEWSSFQNLDGRDKDKGPTVIFKQQLARNQVFHSCGIRSTETGLFPCGFAQAHRCPKKTGDSGYYIYKSTKTVGGVRRVPIPKVLAQVLLEHKARQDEWKRSPAWNPPKGLEDLVFTTKTGQPIRHQQDTKDWRKLCDELGLGDLRGHTARHFAATTLIGWGFPIEVVGQIIGHASEEITRRIYTKATEEAMTPAVQDYEDILLKDRNDAAVLAMHEAYKRYDQMAKEFSENEPIEKL